MRSTLAFVVSAALASPAALAGITSQTVTFDYDAVDGVALPVVQGFDTLGGTRALTGVTFEFRHNFALDVFVESTGPTAVQADDFVLSIAYISLFQLGDGEGETSPPFFGPGGIYVENVSGGLAAYDGVPGNDGPDSYRFAYTEAYTATQIYSLDEPDVLLALTDVGPLTTVLGGFTEMFFFWVNDPNWPIPAGKFPEYPTDAALWVNIPSFRHFGELEITYEYAVVPAPAGATAVGVLCAFSYGRRRRR